MKAEAISGAPNQGGEDPRGVRDHPKIGVVGDAGVFPWGFSVNFLTQIDAWGMMGMEGDLLECEPTRSFDIASQES